MKVIGNSQIQDGCLPPYGILIFVLNRLNCPESNTEIKFYDPSCNIIKIILFFLIQDGGRSPCGLLIEIYCITCCKPNTEETFQISRRKFLAN